PRGVRRHVWGVFSWVYGIPAAAPRGGSGAAAFAPWAYSLGAAVAPILAPQPPAPPPGAARGCAATTTTPAPWPAGRPAPTGAPPTPPPPAPCRPGRAAPTAAPDTIPGTRTPPGTPAPTPPPWRTAGTDTGQTRTSPSVP